MSQPAAIKTAGMGMPKRVERRRWLNDNAVPLDRFEPRPHDLVVNTRSCGPLYAVASFNARSVPIRLRLDFDTALREPLQQVAGLGLSDESGRIVLKVEERQV